MKTYLQLKTQIREAIWADGEAENLISQHDIMFEEAMAEIQKWVPCERDNNVNVFPFCSTWFRCGLTSFAAPNGIILRLYTIVINEEAEWCDPVFYRQKEWPEPEKWARNIARYEKPLNVGFPRLPQGFQYAEASTDFDSPCGRARAGIWSIWAKRIYAAPWIQSNEAVVVEWRGIKTEWGDNDPVNEDIDFRTCVKYYVAWAHERDFGAGADSPDTRGKRKLFDDKLADLIHECNERTRKRSDLDYDDTRSRLTAEIEDDAAPDPVQTVFAHMGNYATNSATEEQISQLVRSWFPKYLLASGQNVSSAAGDYDADVGQYFHDFIFPYVGTYGDGAALNMFWPALGLSDWEAGANNLAQFKSFFKLPNNEQYYELVRGDVHFFFIDTDSREPDGITQGSTQGAWLQAKLALSTSLWKVVVMSKPPFSSGQTTGSTTDLQWPFETWGANLVIAGEAGLYERITVGGISYIVNGLGGLQETIAASPVTGSEIQYNEEYGALKFTVSTAALKVEFWNRYGLLIDTLELTV